MSFLRQNILFFATLFFFTLLHGSSCLATTCNPELLAKANQGDVNVQSLVAHLYASDKDYEKARYWYRRVINHPDADTKIIAHANLIMGLLFNSGKGGKQDYPTAMKCFRVAAKQGYFDAHISIGNLYARGLGVEQNYNKALYWWQLAAEKGHPDAPNLVYLLQKEIGSNTLQTTDQPSPDALH